MMTVNAIKIAFLFFPKYIFLRSTKIIINAIVQGNQNHKCSIQLQFPLLVTIEGYHGQTIILIRSIYKKIHTVESNKMWRTKPWKPI